MLPVRQSTARTVMIGPVLDADGAAVTDCVVGDFKLSVNGGAPAALNGSATLTHRHTGMYSLALTATDLATVGSAEVTIDDTANACSPKELVVIEEAVYDALFAASALGYVANAPVNVAQISGDSTAADNAEAFFDGTGYAGTGNTIPTVTTVNGLAANTITATSIASNAITAAKIATDAITADKIAADAIGSSELAASAVTEIQSGLATATALATAQLDLDTLTGSDGVILATTQANYAPAKASDVPTADTIADSVWEEALADHEGTVGSVAEALADAGGSGASAADIADAVLDEALSGHTTAGTLGKAIADVLEDTGTTIPALIGSPAGASVSADIAAVKTQTAAIEVDTQDLQTQVGTDGAGLTNIPWNASWDTEVQSEVTDALNAYDPPTNAEMESRTLAAADYATATALATVDGNVDSILEDTGTTLPTTLSSIAGYIDTEIGTLQTSINDLPTNAELTTALASADDATLAAIAALNNVTAAQVATAVFTTAMTEAYRATGAAPTLAQFVFEVIGHLGNSSITGTTKTVKKLDTTTTAKTYELDSDTTPTAIEELS